MSLRTLHKKKRIYRPKACVACSAIYQPLQSSRDRFCSLRCRVDYYVIKQEGCWSTRGLKPIEGGYFRLNISGKIVSLHRAAYIAYVSDPGDLHVLHSCDNPGCCNPSHLFLGTHTDNMRDLIKKGYRKTAVGEACGRSKLTTADVIAIKSMEGTHTHIAKLYGVYPSTIWSILRGKTWKHIP